VETKIVPRGLWPKLGLIAAGVTLIILSNLVEFSLGAIAGMVIAAAGVFGGLKYFWDHDEQP
jgi:ribose/xylose/arabinose/galactoside ABC-type transport system permease subunit